MSHHIEHIEISNFKSIRHATIEGCKRINVFIGYPNVGKSNILEAIGLLSVPQVATGEAFFLNEIIRLKHFSELFFDKNYRTNMSVEAKYEKVNAQINEIQAVGTIGNSFEKFTVTYKHYTTQADGNKSHHHSVKAINCVANISGDNYGISINPKAVDTSDYKIKKYTYTDNPNYTPTNNFSLSIPNGGNLIDLLHRNFDFGAELVEIFKEYGLKLFLETDSISLTKELPNGISVRIPYYQMADTLRRLIFYKAAIMSNENSVLLFEEPEAHMFPPYISNLTGDIIGDKNNNQFFIATHSPFVLNDLIEDAKEELSIYAVGLQNGETTIKRISDEDVKEIYQYGIDLFFNLEDYLKNDQGDHS